MEDHLWIFSHLLEENSSDDDELLQDLCWLVGCVGRTNINRKYSFVQEIVNSFSDEEFKRNFRLTREAFNWVQSQIKDKLDTNSKYKANIPSEKQLLAAIWILSTPDSYRQLKALNNVAAQIIKWPNADDREEIQQQFYSSGQIPGCVGAIDGTYIPIKAPTKNPEVYINRKCFYGITLQAICDYNRKFIDIFFENQFIIGDKAYPLCMYCITPYIDRGNLQAHHLHFNKRHAQTRQVIERSFALLFGRFRHLKYLDMTKTEFIPQTVQAACVLHNVCLMHQGNFEQYEEEGLQFLNIQNYDHDDNEEALGVEGIAREFREHNHTPNFFIADGRGLK
ncbi:hypothetical protein NQ314_012964 [Rhamnusium bicolor]|uniref:DDE Tnp4 domain-containing protein n=1 Tax=Rhamnusium bicolor TaxID=1586634 RepID=A0AAV8X9I8_9CUCU|nr:hypothetical protein NQ314_012964 [Rhamnusium bicolor]